ncbi:MAG: hypothetical protein WC538_04295 [Thermoanaerobaculia bacterium]|jgi:hypothetical protein
MNGPICAREAELVAALASGRWPEAADRDLRDHVDSCSECSELAHVASSIDDDRRAVEGAVSLPPAGAAWWRVQMRMERETREAAARTVRRAHSAIVLATVGAVVAVLAMTSLLGAAWSWLTGALPTMRDLAALQPATPSVTTLAIAAVGLAVLTPLIVWLAVAEE